MATAATNPLGTAANAFSSPTVGKLAGQEQTLASWAAPYITDMLGKTQALASTPYQTYQGPLTAGTSPLQQQAFQGVGSLAPSQGLGTAQGIAGGVATAAGGLGYGPSQFQNQFATPGGYEAGKFEGGIFGTQQAQQYMNPYLQQALNPALDEARRQAEMSRVQQAGRLTKAGAFGGGRQAIMESELNRNLMQAQNKMLGEGYASAYDKAMAQYNADMARAMQAQQMGEQSRQFGAGQGLQAAQLAAQYGTEAQRQAEQSRQFGAQYGLQGLAQQLDAARTLGSLGSAYGAEQRANLAQQLGAGATQRDIEGQGIAADLAEFERQRQFPYQQLQFQQAMLQNMPITAMNMTYQEPSPFSELLTGTGGLMGLYERLFGKG
jgi:hypothetical protein